jgi:hypothetical protein
VTDPCCHFGELLISDDPAGAALHVHAKPPSAPVYPPS